MPEGDSLHRAARRIQALVGDEVAAEAPHPRGAAVASLVDGRRLLAARAVGKNLLLEFEGDVVVRSHLRMHGRWSVVPAGSRRVGRPWLVLRGREQEAVLWNGPVLELDRGRRPAARAGHPHRRRGGHSPPARRSAPGARRGHPRPARRRGDREPVEGRGALACARLAVANRRRDVRRGAPARPRRSGAADEVVGRGWKRRRRSRRRPPENPGRLQAPGGWAPAAGRLPPRRPALSALRESRPLARPGGRQPDGVLVSNLPAVDELARRSSPSRAQLRRGGAPGVTNGQM